MQHAHKNTALRHAIYLLLLLALAGGAQSADAAKGGAKALKQAAIDDGTTKDTTATSEDDTKTASSGSGGPHSGDIDPTTVPIIDEDLLFSVAMTRAQIQADEAHGIATGKGVVVAVLDAGFNLDHPDIAANILPGYDALDDDDDVNDFGNGVDDDGDGWIDGGLGHGTFVIGMILQAAPDALIVPVRIRDDEGYGSDDVTMKGLEYARGIGADVVNFSGGSAQATSRQLYKAFQSVAGSGITIVVAAGNDGWNDLDRLGKSGFALAVGAVDCFDQRAPFSNWWGDVNPPMIMAPGVDLYGPLGAPHADARGYWSGTSFSAGLASGAAALVLETHPYFAPQGVFAHLAETGDQAWRRNGLPLDSTTRINLYNAVTR